MKILYRKHVNGIGTWKITGDPTTGLIVILHASAMGGSEVRHEERVTTNLSGRSLVEQVDLRVKSRIGRMLDRGYKWTIHDAEAGMTNQLGLKLPMLAQQLQDVRHVNYEGSVLQKKLDGFRSLITKHDGNIVSYSRKGKIFSNIAHITGPLQDIIPEGVSLDGELWSPAPVPLQTIASWIKRNQPDTKKLWFVCYDLISNEPYQDRLSELTEILHNKPDAVKILPGRPFESTDQMWNWHKEVVLNGRFDGLILRPNDRGYEDGVRSRSLIKVKNYQEMEVIVRGATASKQDWAILQCETPNGKIFGCSAPGTIEQKREVLRNIDKYIGKKLTIKYQCLTKDEIPFQPTALRWYVEL